MKHSSYTLLKGAINSLCYSILLRPVAHRVLPFNALRIAKVPHAVAHVFSYLVIAQYAYSPVSAVLSRSFELFELRECHTLCLHGGNTVETSSASLVQTLFRPIVSLEVFELILHF